MHTTETQPSLAVRLLYVGMALIVIAGLALAAIGSRPSTAAGPVNTQTLHKTVKVDGLDIFYREAGRRDAPTILLLHGFPTSSQMFRNLIPALADRFHLIAPDYPGFGHSAAPSVEDFDYTFDNLAEVIDKFTQKLALPGLFQCLTENFLRKLMDLDVHLQSSDTLACSSDLEIHIAGVVFIAQDIRQNDHIVLVFDQPHGNAGHGGFDRNTTIHQRHDPGAHGPHRGRAIGLQNL